MRNLTASETKAPKENGTVILRRTFNQSYDGPNGLVVLKFWRVIGPANHKNLNSDLSVLGLKDWGIISE